MSKSWKTLENYVQAIASILWKTDPAAERIAGVNFDSVIRVSEEHIVLIEITEEFNLEKVRGDVSKIQSVKYKMVGDGILVKGYIVLSRDPTPGMLEVGRENKIDVLSVESFARQAFAYSDYVALRNQHSFGSAINPTTGESDRNEYVDVVYKGNQGKNEYSITEISRKLISGEKLVLLGDYGTGKSRCTKEIFRILSTSVNNASGYALSINLRDHWGARSAVEIISGHLTGIGLSSSIDRTMQLLHAGHLILLLDGFDEVGAQTFGVAQRRRATVRKEALQGIRDLITKTTGGVLVTGRPHYFNSNQEMIDSLGISSKRNDAFLIECENEFTDLQAESYLAKIGLASNVPKWLPRKPLMFLILAAIEPEQAKKILANRSGEVGFWGQFIDTVCEREAKIHSSLDSASVRMVLSNLAKMTRESTAPLGRLTPKDINNAYELATGDAPDEAGQLMLSRLCTLGRIEPESPDRQFVDPYIVQWLFAENLIEAVSSKDFDLLKIKWKQALEPMGLNFLAEWIEHYSYTGDAIGMICRETLPNNSQALGELAGALTLISGDPIDLKNAVIQDAEVCIFNLGSRDVLNVSFNSCVFRKVNFNECKVSDASNAKFNDCIIMVAESMSSATAAPNWLTGCVIEDTQNVSNSSRIKLSVLPASQKLFLSLIHKIFFQYGGGRKESSLYKGGFGQAYDRKIIDKILHTLVQRGYIEKSKDGSGHIYNPNREYTAKMKAIKDHLSLSDDELWIEIGKLT